MGLKVTKECNKHDRSEIWISILNLYLTEQTINRRLNTKRSFRLIKILEILQYFRGRIHFHVN